MEEVVSCTPSLQDRVERLRSAVDTALEASLHRVDQAPARLRDAIAYSLMAPGKRLRPTLVLLATEACGGESESALPAACAVEMVHTYSLIHDDLPAMDDDDLRRGQLTCHKKFDEATAILAGDALLTLAFELLAAELQPGELAAQCAAELAHAAGAIGMVGGQADDLVNAELKVSEQAPAEIATAGHALESIHRRKTGALFLASLRLGGYVARADREQLAALDAYGQRIGLAFQIVDDLLDISGQESHLGKRVGKDAGQGKLTFPGVFGAAASRDRAEHLVREACEEVENLGMDGAPLAELARYILERNH